MTNKQEQYLELKNAELEKQLAEKNRDLEIEAALERVRTVAMGMRAADDLLNICKILFEELTVLGFAELRNAMINIVNDEKGSFLNYDFNGIDASVTPFLYNSHPVMERQVAMTRSARDAFFEHVLTGDDLEDFKAFRVRNGEAADPKLENVSTLYYYFYSIGVGSVGISAFSSLPEEKRELLKRFRNVFDLAYRRYADIQLAAAQAREAQIELALERVRARTMAMQQSSELAETAFILFQQFKELGENPDQATIGIINEEEHVIEYWVTMYGSQINKVFKFSIDEPNVTHKIYKGWKTRKKSLVIDLSGKVLLDFATYRQSMGGAKLNKDEKRRVINVAFFSKGIINVQSNEARSEESIRLLERFAGVFEGTYTRFLDLKRAEAQARESQIELALERMRAKTMAMQKSEELPETSSLLFQQVKELGEAAIQNSIAIINEETGFVELSTTVHGSHVLHTLHVPIDDPFVMAKAVAGWKAKRKSLTLEFTGQELKDYNALRNSFLETKIDFPEDLWAVHISFFSKGWLSFSFSKNVSDELIAAQQRFAAVFDQTYTRFLDLQKAEAQAREAQVELSLERIRAKTMAMHTSEHVGETVATMFDELVKLGIEKTVRCGILIIDETKHMEVWTAAYDADGKVDMLIGRIDMMVHTVTSNIHEAWKNKEQVRTYELVGKDLKAYYKAINDSPEYPVQFDLATLPEKQINNAFFFPEGAIFAFTLEPLTENAVKLFKRFAGVFGLTYRRYLDLQKAEQQAKDARVEVALERVRSKTMAMHNSGHVAETVATMFDELVKLGVDKSVRCGIGIINENKIMEVWTAYADPDVEKVDLVIGRLDMTTHQMLSGVFDNWKKKETHSTYTLTGNDQVDYYRAINNSDDYSFKFDIASLPEKQFQNAFYFREGFIYVFSHEQLSLEQVQIYKRFAGVFGLTYRRYLDLMNAEEQAREAQIEAALERVRGKAMAMRSSGDLNDTANTVFIELRKLDVDLVRCGLGLMEKETHISTIHAATNSDEGGSLEVLGNIDMNIHPVLEDIYNQWRQNKDYFPVLEGESLKAYYEKLHESGISVPELKSGEKQYGYFLQFAYGSLYAWSGKQESEITIKTIKRFTSVIGLTYTRYIELQNAEFTAKDAIKQASLDRVRAEIASMRSTEDLDRITPLVWNELTTLGIPFIRCGVFIVDEEEQVIHTHLSAADGKALATFNLLFDSQGIGQNILPAWRAKETATIHWSEEEFAEYTKNLVEQGTVKSQERYVTEHPDTSLDLHFLPFLQGMLYVGNTSPLTRDEMDLVQSLADAFSTAYARYEDFNKLEIAKQQVDNTLTDLKAAQTKLIQSEKMASLGELTAGIAHEIQNPLNFVNNFSEVNQEMIDELTEELKAGNIEEALAIAADIKDNEEKINHHGKRADGIVKGMLQHSRSGGGEKQLTNMNTLADEFLRLSYHGLRAKDKVFNAELVTNFDPNLPKISVIGQDMGRVMLNLFNNAFYAVNQKMKAGAAGYKPEVSVSTSTENGQVIIKVKDNGTGIPDAVKEKIMQPFFTTKPTGEGTGLGLSLTYDMVVKGHGGSINVDTKYGEYTQFIVALPLS